MPGSTLRTRRIAIDAFAEVARRALWKGLARVPVLNRKLPGAGESADSGSMSLNRRSRNPALRREPSRVVAWALWTGAMISLSSALAWAPAVPRKAARPTNLVSGEIRGWSVPYRKDGELKAKLSGASARPLPGGELEIRELRVETYRDSELQAVLTTPACRYRQGDDSVISTNSFAVQLADERGQLEGQGFHLRLAAKEVSSSGRFSASGPNGRPQLRGEGFLFRLEAGQLNVSNQVQLLLPVRLPQRFRL